MPKVEVLAKNIDARQHSIEALLSLIGKISLAAKFQQQTIHTSGKLNNILGIAHDFDESILKRVKTIFIQKRKLIILQ